jgi:hypothetical protein
VSTEFAGWSGIRRSRRNRKAMESGLFSLPREERLALEMALHEEAERRAMQGELTELEAAWRNAEEIAGIADSLLVSPDVDEALKKIKNSK